MVCHVCELLPIHGPKVSIHRTRRSLLTSVDGICCDCFVTVGSAGLGGLNALRLLTTLRERHVTRRR